MHFNEQQDIPVDLSIYNTTNTLESYNNILWNKSVTPVRPSAAEDSDNKGGIFPLNAEAVGAAIPKPTYMEAVGATTLHPTNHIAEPPALSQTPRAPSVGASSWPNNNYHHVKALETDRHAKTIDD